MLRRLALILCVTALSVLSANVAQAQIPYGGDLAAWNGWGGYGYGSGWGYLGTRVGYVPQPPYFAIHPPVYYSAQIIRRPYGTSPFAWPATYPGFTNVPIEAASTVKADPVFIINPYVGEAGGGQLPPPREAAPANNAQSKARPLCIRNPHHVARKE
jgi:hypothetical protein